MSLLILQRSGSLYFKKHHLQTYPVTAVGFEPTRGDPIGLAGRRLNRSAKVSLMIGRPSLFFGASSGIKEGFLPGKAIHHSKRRQHWMESKLLSFITFCENVLPRRVRCARQCAMPVHYARAPEQARRDTSPDKNKCDKQVSSWRHISCHTDKNRYYT